MLHNDTLLTLQYERKEQMMGNEESLEKVQDLITAIKSTYYATALLSMTETEFNEWFKKYRLLVLVSDVMPLNSFEDSLKKYIQIPSVSDENITLGILHFEFNGEILREMLEWGIKIGAAVVIQETVKEWRQKVIERIKKIRSKDQTQENQESLEETNQESNVDHVINLADNLFKKNQGNWREISEEYSSITVSSGDVSIKFEKPNTELPGSQKN
ncbi:hypothetical protein [Bacillus cereus group sp. MYBK104-1]|uniref:hypothetical protein n=1 Tax=unclassified Bacillus cereus group TaxID=2750818 RepID=UPI003F79F487